MAKHKTLKLEPISGPRAVKRFLDVRGRGGRRRNPELDALVSAQRVAPADPEPDDVAGIRLQHQWYRNPNQLDFEGIDTKKTAPRGYRDRKSDSQSTPSQQSDRQPVRRQVRRDQRSSTPEKEHAPARIRLDPPTRTFHMKTAPAGTRTTASSIVDPRRTYDFEWRIVDLDELVTSHTDNFSVNAEYPQELQPRERSRAAPKLQVQKIAKTLSPDAYLVDTKQIDRGAPIVGDDLAVESGNGRTIALRYARTEFPEQWTEYQRELRQHVAAGEYGITPDQLAAVEDPVLVRVRTTPTDRVEFARDANQKAVLEMSPVEKAADDAQKISDNVLAQLTLSENQTIDQALTSAGNRPLVHHYLQQLPDNERAGLVDARGTLNLHGLQRLKAALFAKVYPGDAGARLANTFFESIDPMVKNIEHGMFAALPGMAKAEGRIRTGQRAEDLSLAEDMSKAVDMLARLKQQGLAVDMYLAQDSFLGKELTADQERLLAHLSEVSRSPKRVRELLNEYSDAVESSPHPDQGAMLDMAKATKGETIDSIMQQQRLAMLQGRRNRRQNNLWDDPAPRTGGEKLAGADGSGPPLTQRWLDRAPVGTR